MDQQHGDSGARGTAEARGSFLLWGGIAVGVVLSALGILRSGATEAPPLEGAIASVNGRSIPEATYVRLVEAVAEERRLAELGIDERRRILERMVDEELLLQRGISLGLARHEPTARRAIVQAVIASITGAAEAAEPEESELRSFYDEARDRFVKLGRMAIDPLFFSNLADGHEAARTRAEGAVVRLRAGEAVAQVRESIADEMTLTLPGQALPLETIRQYLGPSVARTVAGLEVGDVSEPVAGAGGYYVVFVRERTPDEALPFEEVRPQVRAELLRTRGETALRDYLVELRDVGDVAILDPELTGP